MEEEMKLEDQVINLKLAEKLKELGLEQESLFYWYERFTADGEAEAYVERSDPDAIKYVGYYPAYTVAELFKLHYDDYGMSVNIPLDLKPEGLADYLAEQLIANKEDL